MKWIVGRITYIKSIKKQHATLWAKAILLTMGLVYAGLVITTPVHESVHWCLFELEPWANPTGMGWMDIDNYWVGYTTYEETYPGAFDDRPSYMNVIHEVIAYSIQFIIVFPITVFIAKKYLRGKLKKLNFNPKDDGRKECIISDNDEFL